MRKHFILFSAIVMAASIATGCGNTTSTSTTSTSSQAESSSVAESQTEELVEVDPFDDLNLIFFHLPTGEVMEKDRGVYSQTKCYNVCKEHGCNINYDYSIDDVIEEGKTFPIRIICTDLSSDATDEETIDYVKEKYGVTLTRASIEMNAKFEEDPIEDCDPFEGVTFDFYEDSEGYAYYDTNINDCAGASIISQHDCPLWYKAIYPDGKDANDLTEGDVIKYVIAYSPDNNETIYTGEEAKESIEEYQWYRLNITRTEYETTIDLSNGSSESEE